MSNGMNLEDINVLSAETLMTPAQLKNKLPVSERAMTTVREGRRTIKNILNRTDPRLFLVVGPCSIHDTKAALDYAERLKKLAAEVDDTLFLVMRVYFEKPRTTVGWKGLINDPHLDDSFDVSSLSEDLYREMMPAIEDNFDRLLNLESSFDRCYRLYIEPSEIRL